MTILSRTLPDGPAVKSLPITVKILPFANGQMLPVMSVPTIPHRVMVPPAR